MRTIELTWEDQSSSNYFVREAFNTLRANILFSGKNVKVIVVTSCYAHEGKSSVSFDLCRNLAESGKKVLLVDADLRRSAMLSRYTKERGVYGLSQVLSGQVDAENATYHTNVDSFDIVFAGPYPPNPTELVGSAAFKEFVDGVRAQYDYVIIDAPPLGLVIDAAVMSSVCDGAVMVINIGHVKYRVAQGVKAQLEKSGCKVLGVVLNQVDRKRTLKSDRSYYSAYISETPVSGNRVPKSTAQQSQVTKPASAAPQPQVRPATSTPARRPVNPSGARVARPVQAPKPQSTVPQEQPAQPTQSTQPQRPMGTVPPAQKKED
ncbi:MAG: polysaccharide biosynthesis tyrosine autokinase [Clostridia bacterium]|nr:polysaccharide biosynthesis tyrosine autokinase [Clostridia bacterium]